MKSKNRRFFGSENLFDFLKTTAKSKILGLSITLIILVLLNLTLINGLGISPAGKTIDFQPNAEVELEFNIINSEQNTFEARLISLGELADIIFFEKNSILVKAENYRTPFKTIIKFPSQMEPGIHKGAIEINPLLPGLEDNMFAAYIAPQIPIKIRVPFPAKYADINLVVLDVDEGTPVPVFVEFDNLGSEDIQRAGAEIGLFTPDDESITTLITPEISIAQGFLGKTQAQPSPVMRKGLYKAVVKAYYDDIEKTFETNFTLGTPFVRIRKLITKALAKDEINKVVFKVYNEWNTELTVNGFIEMDGQQNKMPVFKLGKDEEKEVTGFFDTTGLELGDHQMNITLVYADQIKTHTFLVKVSEKIEKPKPSLKISPLLIIVIIILVIIIILVLVLLLVKKRKKA